MASNGRLKNGRFVSGNTFARSHGAPPGNQNARGHGAPARNVNAMRHGIYLKFKDGERPEDRLPPGAGSDALDMLKEAKKLHDHWAAFRAIAERAGIRVPKYPY